MHTEIGRHIHALTVATTGTSIEKEVYELKKVLADKDLIIDHGEDGNLCAACYEKDDVIAHLEESLLLSTEEAHDHLTTTLEEIQENITGNIEDFIDYLLYQLLEQLVQDKGFIMDRLKSIIWHDLEEFLEDPDAYSEKIPEGGKPSGAVPLFPEDYQIKEREEINNG